MFRVLCAFGCCTVYGAGPCSPDIAAEQAVPATMLQLPCHVPAGRFLRLRVACWALLFAAVAAAVRMVGAVGLVTAGGLLAAAPFMAVAGREGEGFVAGVAAAAPGLPIASAGLPTPVPAAAAAAAVASREPSSHSVLPFTSPLGAAGFTGAAAAGGCCKGFELAGGGIHKILTQPVPGIQAGV